MEKRARVPIKMKPLITLLLSFYFKIAESEKNTFGNIVASVLVNQMIKMKAQFQFKPV